MHPYLLPVLEHTPVILERLLRVIPARRLSERSDPDRFTLHEAVGHLADWEPILLGRVQAGVERPVAEVPAIDESQRAIEQDYGSWDLEESLRKFRESRSRTVEYLSGLTSDQWEAWVNHSERGRMTVYDMANLLLGHDLYHLEHATQFLEPKTAATW